MTSDYHVFRTAEYAHKIGLAADGVGSRTARYFWPTAFIREYVAVSNAHRWPFVVIFVSGSLSPPSRCSSCNALRARADVARPNASRSHLRLTRVAPRIRACTCVRRRAARVRACARVRHAWLLAFALACFCTSNLVLLAALLLVGFALAASCGMVRPTIGLAKAVFAFSLILAVVQVLTTPTGAVLVELPWGYIGAGSLLAALTTIVRLVAAAIPLFLVFYVTKMNDITNAVVKVLHVPYKYAFTFTSTIHFIPMFMNDMKGIMEAQTARGVEFDAGGIVRKVRLMVPLCVPLLVSSVRKTNSAAIAAEVRGFQPAHRDKRLQGSYPFRRSRRGRDGGIPRARLRSPWPWECCCNGCGSGSLAGEPLPAKRVEVAC